LINAFEGEVVAAAAAAPLRETMFLGLLRIFVDIVA
jgi:hypothetical protein